MSGIVAISKKNCICIAHPWRRRAAHLGCDLNAVLASGTEHLNTVAAWRGAGSRRRAPQRGLDAAHAGDVSLMRRGQAVATWCGPSRWQSPWAVVVPHGVLGGRLGADLEAGGLSLDPEVMAQRVMKYIEERLWHPMSLIHMIKLIICLRDIMSCWSSKSGFKFRSYQVWCRVDQLSSVCNFFIIYWNWIRPHSQKRKCSP
jgi:hypothetical protein